MKKLEIRENLVDRAIQFVAPSWGARRRHARAMLAMTEGYTAGRRDRRQLKDYNPLGGSPDADINWDLDLIRRRSRDLVRNNCIGGGAINTATNHTVGTGLALNPHIDRNILAMDENEARKLEAEINTYWRIFVDECDFKRKHDLYGLQGLVFRSALENGDALAVLPNKRRYGNVFGLKIQLVEGDRLANPTRRADSLEWSGGVRLDGDGVPIGYNILSYHPGDIKAGLKREEKEYAAYDSLGVRRVLHVYKALRIDQHRGVPYLAPVIEVIKQLGRYTDAEVDAAVVSSLFTVFTKTEGRQGIDDGEITADENTTGTGNSDLKLQSGMILDLAPGEDVEIANPGRPNPQFDPFVMALCRQVGMALEIPYEVLIKHFTASYSASRAALLELWMFVRSRRAWMVQDFCAPVYEAFLWEAVSAGYLNLPGFLNDPVARRAYLGAEWIGDAMPTVDPVKDVAAAEKRIALKLTTRSEECMALTGTEWEPKVGQMKREEGLLGSQESGARSPEEGREEEERGDEEDEAGMAP